MNHKTLCLTLSLRNLQKSFKYIHRSWFCTFLILYYLLSYPYLMLSTTHVLSNIENKNLINNLSVPIYFSKISRFYSLELICKACKIEEIYGIEICQPSIGMHQTYFAWRKSFQDWKLKHLPIAPSKCASFHDSALH